MRARRALRCHCLSARACNLSAREIVTLVRVRSLSLIACALAARCDVTVSLNHSLSNLCQAKRCASRASVTAAAADDASKTLAAEQSDAEAARDTDAVVRVTARDTALAAAHEILSSAAACDEAEHSHARDTEAETVSRAAAEIEARLFDLRFEFDERAHEKAPNLWVCHPSNRAYALSVENPSEESSLEPDMASGDGARSLRSDASHGLVSQDTLTRGIMHPHFIVSRSVRCRPDRQRPLVVLGTSACNTSRARFSRRCTNSAKPELTCEREGITLVGACVDVDGDDGDTSSAESPSAAADVARNDAIATQLEFAKCDTEREGIALVEACGDVDDDKSDGLSPFARPRQRRRTRRRAHSKRRHGQRTRRRVRSKRRRARAKCIPSQRVVEDAKNMKEAKGVEEGKCVEEAKCAEEANGVEKAKGAEEAKGAKEAQGVEETRDDWPSSYEMAIALVIMGSLPDRPDACQAYGDSSSTAVVESDASSPSPMVAMVAAAARCCWLGAWDMMSSARRLKMSAMSAVFLLQPPSSSFSVVPLLKVPSSSSWIGAWSSLTAAATMGISPPMTAAPTPPTPPTATPPTAPSSTPPTPPSPTPPTAPSPTSLSTPGAGWARAVCECDGCNSDGAVIAAPKPPRVTPFGDGYGVRALLFSRRARSRRVCALVTSARACSCRARR